MLIGTFHSFKCTGLNQDPSQDIQNKSEDHERGKVPHILATFSPQGRGYLTRPFELQVPVDAVEMGKVYNIALTEVKEEAPVGA